MNVRKVLASEVGGCMECGHGNDRDGPHHYTYVYCHYLAGVCVARVCLTHLTEWMGNARRAATAVSPRR